MASVGTDQYVFDWSSRQNDRCSLLLQLRSIPIDLKAGRLNGVIELLERLTLFARYLPESLSQPYTVEAQVMAIAARIERRRSVSERTVRSWTVWAKELGVLDVQYTSLEYGGHRWNAYTVHFARVLELLRSRSTPCVGLPSGAVIGHGKFRAEAGGSGRKRAEATSDPGAEATSDPGAEATSDLTYCSNKKFTDHSPVPAASTSEAIPPVDCERERVVVSALLKMGMCDAARGVRKALTRGLTFETIDQLTERYRALQQSDNRVTIAWLYRWLMGQSRPEEPRAPAPKRTITPVIDRGSFERARAEAAAIAAVDEPLAVQLQRRREQMLGGASNS